jgi:hypothetical protein
MPLTVVAVTDPTAAEQALAAYERRFVLVRPDGHVAWRGDQLPAHPVVVIDTVRGMDPEPDSASTPDPAPAHAGA